MTRMFLTRTGMAAAAGGLMLLALAAIAPIAPSVSAQGAPPAPPIVYYGSAAGTTEGATVTALVQSGGKNIACGTGEVLNDGGNLVYAVQVITDSQRTGCGDTGRQVRFYVLGEAGEGGRVSGAVNWPGADTYAVNYNLSLGSELAETRIMPMAASDGLPQ